MKLKPENMGNGIFKLLPEHCKEILENGFCMVDIGNGKTMRVTKDNLYIEKKDVYKILKEKNNPE